MSNFHAAFVNADMNFTENISTYSTLLMHNAASFFILKKKNENSWITVIHFNRVADFAACKFSMSSPRGSHQVIEFESVLYHNIVNNS